MRRSDASRKTIEFAEDATRIALRLVKSSHDQTFRWEFWQNTITMRTVWEVGHPRTTPQKHTTQEPRTEMLFFQAMNHF